MQLPPRESCQVVSTVLRVGSIREVCWCVCRLQRPFSQSESNLSGRFVYASRMHTGVQPDSGVRSNHLTPEHQAATHRCTWFAAVPQSASVLIDSLSIVTFTAEACSYLVGCAGPLLLATGLDTCTLAQHEAKCTSSPQPFQKPRDASAAGWHQMCLFVVFGVTPTANLCHSSSSSSSTSAHTRQHSLQQYGKLTLLYVLHRGLTICAGASAHHLCSQTRGCSPTDSHAAARGRHRPRAVQRSSRRGCSHACANQLGKVRLMLFYPLYTFQGETCPCSAGPLHKSNSARLYHNTAEHCVTARSSILPH